MTPTLIAEHGLGFGTGTISAATRSALPGNDDLAELVRQTVMSGIIVPLTTDASGQPVNDDGCGDGRAVSGGSAATNRAKVFGGGATMAAAVRIGRGEATMETLGETFVQAENALEDHGLSYGGHTDAASFDSAEKCGCGAIDRAPEIMAAAGTYRTQITDVIKSLAISTEGIDEIIDNFVADAKQERYRGRDAIATITSHHKDVRQLDGEHREMAVVFNLVPGYTIDQAKVRHATNDRGQIFGVDVWRMQQIANGLQVTPLERQRAFLSQLVYSLATAAVLTAGDLPVYVVNK